MKKIITGFVLVSMLIFSAAGFSEGAENIRFGTMPTYSAAIYAVGIEKGFYKNAGVTVDLTVFRSARDRDAAATAGQLDGFMTDIMGAVNLNVKGFPFIITSREHDDFGVMAGPGVHISEGKVPVVGISENTVTEYIVDTFMAQTVEKVNILAVPDRMGALLGGKLDCGVFPQPFMGIITGKGGNPVVTTAAMDFHPVVVVFENRFINTRKTSVDAFYDGYMKTVKYMQTQEFSAYQSVLVKYGLATDNTVARYKLPVNQYGLNPLSEKDFNHITQWMRDKGLLKQDVEFGRVSSTEFIK